MIRQSLIVLFYWFSVAFIGFAILLWLRRARGRFTPLGRIASLALAQNSIIIFMTSFMAACFGSTIMSIFLYCLSLSTEAAVIVYLFALSMAVVYVCTECFKSAVSRKKESVFLMSQSEV